MDGESHGMIMERVVFDDGRPRERLPPSTEKAEVNRVRCA